MISPDDSLRDSSIFPRSSRFRKMLSAGGHVATDTVAPASASAFAIAKPYPASSATPATSARLPRRSMLSMAQTYKGKRASCPPALYALLVSRLDLWLEQQPVLHILA